MRLDEFGMGFPLDGDPDDADSRLSLLKETASSKSVVSPKHCARFASYVGLGAIAAVALVGWGLLSSYDSPRNSLIYSPALGAIARETVTFSNDLGGSSPYVGEPRDELHNAWRELLKYGDTRVSEEDLARIDRTSIPLNDAQGGYLVSLDVYHELHCLNILREQVYREFYPDKHSEKRQLEHADHCIELLRQVLMCHGDVALQTYGWIDGYRWPWPNFTVQHECRRWDKLTEWAAQHSVPDLHGPILTHPKLGVSYQVNDID